MKAFMNWSGGKDSALCLYKSLQQGINIQALVTTISNDRVTMHGVRKELIDQQAKAIGLPLYFIQLDQAGIETYEMAVHEMNTNLKAQGFTHVISGDIFLQDLKEYRQTLYQKDGLTCLFPLWGQSPAKLVNDFIALHFRAVIVAVSGDVLTENYCGQIMDAAFIQSLPESVDACGENGEYHSFVFDGPLFDKSILFKLGNIVKKKYPRPQNEKECFGPPSNDMVFYFQELL
jgi:uncharacterized protein (TIGR00290 family)